MIQSHQDLIHALKLLPSVNNNVDMEEDDIQNEGVSPDNMEARDSSPSPTNQRSTSGEPQLVPACRILV